MTAAAAATEARAALCSGNDDNPDMEYVFQALWPLRGRLGEADIHIARATNSGS